MELVGRRVRLRPVRTQDVEPLAMIIDEPSVAAWWPDGARWVRDKLLAGEPGVTHFIIEALDDGSVIGHLQVWEEPEPDYRHAGIDLFLTAARQGDGLGPDAIRTAIRWLIAERGHHRITIDPAAANGRAIRAYEKVGFRVVGVMRQYERAADGTWHDGLLMDLLAGELVDD